LIHYVEILRTPKVIDSLLRYPSSWILPAKRAKKLFLPKDAQKKREYILQVVTDLAQIALDSTMTIEEAIQSKVKVQPEMQTWLDESLDRFLESLRV